jgi:hypothetical protein
VLSLAGSIGVVRAALTHRASLPLPEPPALALATQPSAPAAPAEVPSDTTRAPDEALVGAVAEGTDGLRVLSERYPSDPRVLKALVLAFASRSNTLLEAVEATRRLLLIAPEEESDPDLRYIVRRAADETGKASELAFVVMSQHMGKAGADLLYALMLDKPELETRAKIALESLRRNKQFSPALAIAYDLRSAPSCTARAALIPRALEVGDRRSAHLLSGLARRPPGCKQTRKRKCLPRCPNEAKALAKAAQDIYQRHPLDG